MPLFSSKRSSSKQVTPANRMRKAMQSSLPVFETMEPRQLMSASTVSAVDYTQVTLVPIHFEGRTIYEALRTPETAVFSIGANGNTYETVAGVTTDLGGTVDQISAGLDTNGNPEVFAVTANGTPFVNDNGAGWKSLGGTVTQISASIDGTVFAIGNGNNVYVDKGSGWSDLGGNALQISAGVSGVVTGQPEVYEIDRSTHAVSVNLDQGGGWVGLGGDVKQISGTASDRVYAIGADNEVFVDVGTFYGGAGWQDLGGQMSQISAGMDASGHPEVFGISTTTNHVLLNDGNGWVDQKVGAVEITAPTVGPTVANTAFGVVGTDGRTLAQNGSTTYSTSVVLDPVQLEYQTIGGQSSSLGAPTSYTQYYSAGSEGFYQNGKIIDKAGTFTVIPSASSIRYQSGYIYTDQPIGGLATLTVNSNGSYSLSYSFNNGSIFPYNYTVSISLISPTGTVFVFSHSYDLSGEGNDTGTITGNDPRIAADWQDLQGCQVIPSATAAFSFGGLLESLGKDILKIGDDIVSGVEHAYSDEGGSGDTSIDDGDDDGSGDGSIDDG